MEKQTAYKLLAAFMILVMIIVPAAYVLTSPRSETAQETQNQNQSQQEKYNPAYWTINQPFYSISDALNMTPVGVVSANYTDLEGMTPQMTQWTRQDQPIINEADSIYNSTTTKLYFANVLENKNRSFLLLSTMSPEKNDFEYIEYPQQVGGNYILVRQEQGLNGLYNVMGTPTILAPEDTLVGVLQIITNLNKTVTAYDQYAGLLSKVDSVPFQTLNSSISFAKQYYMGIGLNNGSYERTTAYLDLNSTTLKKLNQLKANSTDKGFTEYNITSNGNYTIVKIAGSNMLSVINEETS